MNRQTIEENGRKYEALVEGDNTIIIGPPEGLVDEAGLSEPFATYLHNILHARGILTRKDLKGQALIGALQEAYGLDAQKLAELYHKVS